MNKEIAAYAKQLFFLYALLLTGCGFLGVLLGSSHMTVHEEIQDWSWMRYVGGVCVAVGILVFLQFRWAAIAACAFSAAIATRFIYLALFKGGMSVLATIVVAGLFLFPLLLLYVAWDQFRRARGAPNKALHPTDSAE